MADDSDVLLELWRGHREEARQMENQRAALTNIVIIVVAAGFGFLAQQGDLRASSLCVTVPMFILGVFGVLVCTKYGERWARHAKQAEAFARALGQQHQSLDLATLMTVSHTEHSARFPRIKRVKIWALWAVLHAGISTGGLLLSIWALAAGS
jgi:hypothetical protein